MAPQNNPHRTNNFTPDLSTRPHGLKFERLMKASAADLYEAWTEKFDSWFAEPGEILMKPEVNAPFFFYNRHAWGRHPHYGRFIALEKDRAVEMTWVNGKGGTFGAETVLRIDLIPEKAGTRLRLSHQGFEDEVARIAHEPAWREGLEILDEAIAQRAK